MNARLFPNNWRPLRHEIAFAHEHGFECLQLPGLMRGLDAEHLGDSIATVGELLSASGVGTVMEMVVRVGPDGRTAEGATPLDVLHANLPAIIALGCNPVHWHLVPAAPMSAIELAAIEESLTPQLAAAVAIAADQDVRFGLEHNEPGIPLFATIERCITTLEQVPDLGLVWDLNHTLLEQLNAYLALTPRISMLHVSDTPLPETNHHLPLGRGSIDFATYTSQLIRRGFRGRTILEIGGLPKSGGFGQDTDTALIDSRAQLLAAIGAAQLLSTTPTSLD
jgi:sugar phosphate isomerase/epimerase